METKWREMPLVGLDLETTGLDVREDRIFEIGLATFQNGEQVDSYVQLVNPGRPLSRESTEKTGMTDADLADKPSFGLIASKVVEILDGSVLVGYNILGFDLPFLQAELARVGLEVPKCHPVDALVLARGLVPEGGHKLSEMVVRMGLTLDRAHRALDDAVAAVRLLLALAERYQLPADLETLLQLQTQWQAQQDAMRASWRRKRDVSVDVLAPGFQGDPMRTPDGRPTLGASYLYAGELDPLRAYLQAFLSVARGERQD